MDEPTNHMDIVGKESLESMLKTWPGSVLFVSHDRYFVKEIADSLLVFEDGTANFYPYGYEQYWEKQQQKEKERQEQQTEQRQDKAAVVSAKGLDLDTGISPGQEQIKSGNGRKNYNPGKEEAKRKRRQERLEMLIAQKEELLAAYQAQLSEPDVQSDYEKLMELEELRRTAEEELERLMAEWESL